MKMIFENWNLRKWGNFFQATFACPDFCFSAKAMAASLTQAPSS
jgi:hypothetical protein